MPLDVQVEDNSLAAINRKIYEIKKKIQLSEGQRKAQYEECVADKKKNDVKIRQLKKDIKTLREALGKPPDRSEAITQVVETFPKVAGTLRNKNNLQAVQFVDNKAFDQRKKLDLIASMEQWYEVKLRKLSQEKQDFLDEVALKHMKNRDKDAEERICDLENEIHRVEMNIMEAGHVNKKYRAIRGNLLEDGVEFESSLEELVRTIKKQEEEINSLHTVHKEALSLRDLTKGTLLRQEEHAQHKGKIRDRELAECRTLVEERKVDLERLERLIFPSGRQLLQQDSESDSDNRQTSAEEANNAKVIEVLEAAFTVLKQATGVSEYEQVLERFVSQKETQARLSYLKNIAEEEKSAMEERQGHMVAELEAFKFAETRDKEQNVEENERVKKEIDAQTSLRDKYAQETTSISSQTLEIIGMLYQFIKKLQLVDRSPLPSESSSRDTVAMDHMLKILTKKIDSTMLLVGDVTVFDEKVAEIEETQLEQLEQFQALPENVWMFPKSGLEAAAGGGGDTNRPPPPPPPESDDEEDVPTRGFLKRQAQIIIDAKLRRKQFTIPRRGKSGFGK